MSTVWAARVRLRLVAETEAWPAGLEHLVWKPSAAMLAEEGVQPDADISQVTLHAYAALGTG